MDLLLQRSGKIARLCRDTGNYIYVWTDDEDLEVVCDYLCFLENGSITDEASMVPRYKYRRFRALYRFCKSYEDLDSTRRVSEYLMMLFENISKESSR